MNSRPIVYGLIPARGGSKGVKKKNLHNLVGVPLIWHIINSAIQAKNIDRLFVSTEDDDIAESVRSLGVKVIKHNKDLSTDSSPSFPVVRNAVELFKKMNSIPDIIVMLRATSPLCPTHFIDEAVSLLLSNQTADSVISVVKSPVHPFKILRINKDGWLEYFDENSTEKEYPRQRQTFDDVYVRNAAIYATRTTVIEKDSLWGKKAIPMIMPKEVSININDEIDFLFAEALWKKINQARSQ